MSLLSIRNTTHVFEGLRALNDINLEVDAGELTAIIGPNGAGKTTLFNVITGLYRPKHGEIRFCDADITGKSGHEIVKAGIARTFQNIRLFNNLTVLDNVMTAQFLQPSCSLAASLLRLPAHYRSEREQVWHCMRLLGLFGLQHDADTVARNLPYGHQRRLEIVRALATRPRLLLLDEPAAGMNPTEVQELLQLITRLHSEFRLTILLIEHQMRVVMGAAQRVVVLDQGTVIADGEPAAIRRDPVVLDAYLGRDTTTELTADMT